jgi:asparagine synthase (glutamine-hydrolysing)
VFSVARGIPVDQKLTAETTKYALRRALADIVPPHVLNRAKLGFPVPTRPWLKDVMYDWARQIILDSGTGHLVDSGAALRLLDAHRDGPHDYSRKIWTLLVFMVWHGIFVEGRIRPDVPEPVYPIAI